MSIIEKLEAAGRLVAFLEMRKQITAKKLIQKLNPSNSPNGFLLKAENLVEMSNLLHERIAGDTLTQAYMKATKIDLPLFVGSDIDEWEKDEPGRLMAVLAFYAGLYMKIPEWSKEKQASEAAAQLGAKTSAAKKKSSAENGKKGGRPKKPK